MSSSKNNHKGHRERMREKSKNGNLTFLPEHEQLETILFSVIPRGNTNVIAHELLKAFGTIYGVLSADIESLVQVDGVGIKVAEFLHNLPTILGIVQRSKLAFENNNEFVLDKLSKLKDFSISLFSNTVSEEFYAIYLNKNCHMIKFEKISEGSMDKLFVHVGRIARNALINNSYYVAITHNHPSNMAYPSDDDVRATRQISDALSAVGIELFDHIIVAGDKYYSFSENRFM